MKQLFTFVLFLSVNFLFAQTPGEELRYYLTTHDVPDKIDDAEFIYKDFTEVVTFTFNDKNRLIAKKKTNATIVRNSTGTQSFEFVDYSNEKGNHP